MSKVLENYQGIEFKDMRVSYKTISANTMTEIETVILRAEKQFENAVSALETAVVLKQNMIDTLDDIGKDEESELNYVSAKDITDAAVDGLMGTVAPKEQSIPSWARKLADNQERLEKILLSIQQPEGGHKDE